MSDVRLASFRNARSSLVGLSVLAAACAIAACRPTGATPAATVSADTWAVVDGKEITRDAVDKAYRRVRDTSQTLSQEETLAGKLSLLNDLILQEILLAKAAALKLEVPSERAGHRVRGREEEHRRRRLSAGAVEARPHGGRYARRHSTRTAHKKVIDHDIGSKIAVSDQDITDFFNANRAQFNVAEESYHIAQIVVTPVSDPQVANGTGDDATTPQAAAAKIQMLMERLKAGASFRDLAMGYSEDAESAPRGGDLGFVTVSRLKQAPPQLRDAVLNKAPGTVNVVSAGGAHTMVLVAGHQQAGQRDLSTPGVKDQISGTLRGRKEQLLRAAYLTSVRNDAKVVNYMARRLVESSGQMPTAPLATPPGR